MQLQPREALPKIMSARYYSSGLGRFLAIDPASESIRPADPQTWNKYSYVLNNPLAFVDPTGEVLTVSGTKKDKQAFTDTANSGLFGKKAVVGDGGTVTLESTGEQGPPTPEQAAFEETLTTAIEDQGETHLELTASEPDLAAPDDFGSGTVDMRDVSKFGSGPGASGVGVIAHAVAEQYQRQVKGVGRWSQAHPFGVAAENSATGWVRGTDGGPGLSQSAMTGSVSGSMTTPYTRGNQTVNVTIRVKHGDIVDVTRTGP
jgi:RHS repeat-associated protein